MITSSLISCGVNISPHRFITQTSEHETGALGCSDELLILYICVNVCGERVCIMCSPLNGALTPFPAPSPICPPDGSGQRAATPWRELQSSATGTGSRPTSRTWSTASDNRRTSTDRSAPARSVRHSGVRCVCWGLCVCETLCDPGTPSCRPGRLLIFKSNSEVVVL